MADDILIPPQRNERWLNENDTPTQRFAEVVEDIIINLNLVSLIESSAKPDPFSAAKIGQLEKRIAFLEGNQ